MLSSSHMLKDFFFCSSAGTFLLQTIGPVHKEWVWSMFFFLIWASDKSRSYNMTKFEVFLGNSLVLSWPQEKITHPCFTQICCFLYGWGFSGPSSQMYHKFSIQYCPMMLLWVLCTNQNLIISKSKSDELWVVWLVARPQSINPV